MFTNFKEHFDNGNVNTKKKIVKLDFKWTFNLSLIKFKKSFDDKEKLLNV